MKKIAVSIHDVTPGFQRELELIFEELDKLGVKTRSELVVPDYQRKFHLEGHSEFTAMLRAHAGQGIDVSLHGIYHDYAEFYRFDYAAAKEALRSGGEIFTRALGFAPVGFVAPQWLQSRGSRQAVREAGFEYTATMTGVHYRDGKTVGAFPVIYDWGLTSVDRLFTWGNGLKCRWRRGGVIRFSMHPMDVVNGLLGAELRHLEYLLAHGWQATSYARLRDEVANG